MLQLYLMRLTEKLDPMRAEINRLKKETKQQEYQQEK